MPLFSVFNKRRKERTHHNEIDGGGGAVGGSEKSLLSVPTSGLFAARRHSWSSGLSDAAFLPDAEVEALSRMTELVAQEVGDRYKEFVVLCDGKPEKGLNSKQFYQLYKRAFPHAVNPVRLSASVFRLCDKDRNGVVDFAEFLTSICVPSKRIPTMNKFRTLFRILDIDGIGHLSPGTFALAIRDVYDILGLLASSDPHKEAMQLFNSIEHGKDCRVHETEFTRALLFDPKWVSLFEGCNFCVPSCHAVYIGPSSFYGHASSHSPGEESLRKASITSVVMKKRVTQLKTAAAAAAVSSSSATSTDNSDSEEGGIKIVVPPPRKEAKR